MTHVLVRVILAEFMRVSRKRAVAALPIVALLFVVVPLIRAYRLAVALHTRSWVGYPGEPPPPGLGADLEALLYWFRWANLPTASGASLLAGLGIVLFVYAGAVWFEDDLNTGAIKQVSTARKRYTPVVCGKVLALMIYSAGTVLLVMAGAIMVTLFFPAVPGRDLRALLRATAWGSTLVYIGIAWLWTFLGAAVTIASRSGLVGFALGSLWVLAERELLKGAQSSWQLFLAKVTPWSTSQSLLAAVYDRFSWTGSRPLWVVWVTTPPYTKTSETGTLTPYLLPVGYLLGLLLVYLLVVGAIMVWCYYVRIRE